MSGAGNVWADGSGTPWTTVPTRWRIGVPQQLEWFGDADGPSCFDAALARLAAAGAELVPIDLEPFLEAGRLLYGSALVADRAAAFGAFAAAHPDAMDPTVLAIVSAAAGHDATAVFDALDELDRCRRRSQPTWHGVDAIVTPTMARHPRVDEVVADPFGPNVQLGTYTSFVNLLDLCALAVPTGVRPGGLPFGVSLVAPAYRDPRAARAGCAAHARSAVGRYAADAACRRGRAPLGDAPQPSVARAWRAPGVVDPDRSRVPLVRPGHDSGPARHGARAVEWRRDRGRGLGARRGRARDVPPAGSCAARDRLGGARGRHVRSRLLV